MENPYEPPHIADTLLTHADDVLEAHPHSFIVRSFWGLTATQFLGAFNDNLLKNALGIYVIFVLVAGSGPDAGVVVAGQHVSAANLILLAQGLFIAPFFLFSGVSGTLADRIDKAAIARWVKVVEIGIMATDDIEAILRTVTPAVWTIGKEFGTVGCRVDEPVGGRGAGGAGGADAAGAVCGARGSPIFVTTSACGDGSPDVQLHI